MRVVKCSRARARAAALLTLLLLTISVCTHLAASAPAPVASEAASDLPQTAGIEASESDEYSHSGWAPFWSSEAIIATRSHTEPEQILFVNALFRPPMSDRS
jgi:methionine-rich copper-binding protein CopC